MWKTHFHLNHNNGTTKTDVIRIKREIPQGDSFSPLLFCILNKTEYGYKIFNRVICHLFYKDNLKIYALTNVPRQRLLEANLKVDHLSPLT